MSCQKQIRSILSHLPLTFLGHLGWPAWFPYCPYISLWCHLPSVWKQEPSNLSSWRQTLKTCLYTRFLCYHWRKLAGTMQVIDLTTDKILHSFYRGQHQQAQSYFDARCPSCLWCPSCLQNHLWLKVDHQDKLCLRKSHCKQGTNIFSRNYLSFSSLQHY